MSVPQKRCLNNTPLKHTPLPPKSQKTTAHWIQIFPELNQPWYVKFFPLKSTMPHGSGQVATSSTYFYLRTRNIGQEIRGMNTVARSSCVRWIMNWDVKRLHRDTKSFGWSGSLSCERMVKIISRLAARMVATSRTISAIYWTKAPRS